MRELDARNVTRPWKTTKKRRRMSEKPDVFVCVNVSMWGCEDNACVCLNELLEVKRRTIRRSGFIRRLHCREEGEGVWHEGVDVTGDR